MQRKRARRRAAAAAEEEEEEREEDAEEPVQPAAGRATGRGRHDRKRLVKGGYAEAAFEHSKLINAAVKKGKLDGVCKRQCQYGGKCAALVTPEQLKAAHKRMYGSDVIEITGVNDECAWHCDKSFPEIKEQRKNLVLRSIIEQFDPPAFFEQWEVESGGPVCAEFCPRCRMALSKSVNKENSAFLQTLFVTAYHGV